MEPFSKQRLKHAYIFIYPVVYMIFFIILEQTVVPEHIIEVSVDRKIPFCELFIIPYILWFAYIAVTVLVFFLFLNVGDFYRLCMFLFSGMTLFLIISFVYPNGLQLRPDFETITRDNIFIDMVKTLYTADTSTNVLPSLHVYNSICVHIAISKNEFFKEKPWLIYSSFVLMVLIILATMFLKQHSIIDVFAGIFLAAILYPLFYHWNLIPCRKKYSIAKPR